MDTPSPPDEPLGYVVYPYLWNEWVETHLRHAPALTDEQWNEICQVLSGPNSPKKAETP